MINDKYLKKRIQRIQRHSSLPLSVFFFFLSSRSPSLAPSSSSSIILLLLLLLLHTKLIKIPKN